MAIDPRARGSELVPSQSEGMHRTFNKNYGGIRDVHPELLDLLRELVTAVEALQREVYGGQVPGLSVAKARAVVELFD